MKDQREFSSDCIVATCLTKPLPSAPVGLKIRFRQYCASIQSFATAKPQVLCHYAWLCVILFIAGMTLPQSRPPEVCGRCVSFLIVNMWEERQGENVAVWKAALGSVVQVHVSDAAASKLVKAVWH